MIGSYTRVLAALLFFAPTSLSSSQSFAGEERIGNSRGFHVVRGHHRSDRRRARGHRSSFIVFDRNHSVRPKRRLKPLVLQPVSKIMRVTEEQLRRGQILGSRSTFVGTNGKSWAVISRSSSDGPSPIRVEYAAATPTPIQETPVEYFSDDEPKVIYFND